MPRFAANLSMLFTEMAFLDRFAAAARAGFAGVEYLSPYEFEAQAIRERLEAEGLQQVLFNLYAGDWAGGERGLTCLPDRVGEFQDSVGQAIDYAKALGCGQVHAVAGLVPEGADRERVTRIYVDNLKFAAAALGAADIRLLIEPINTRDMPRIFLTGTDQALAVMQEVGSDNLYLQYDVYHMQIMQGDHAATIKRLLPRIAHIQVADVPGRHEPGSGEINYAFLFRHIDAIGYEGWIGCEYVPAGETVSGLGWFAPYRVKG